MQSSLLGFPVSLVFLMPWMVDGGQPCPGNIRVQRGRPPVKKAELSHISPHSSGIVTDSDKCSLKVNRKFIMGLPTSHQLKSCITPNFPKMELRYANLSFFKEISAKKHLKSATKFYCLKMYSGRVVTSSTTYRTTSTFWQGMTLFP